MSKGDSLSVPKALKKYEKMIVQHCKTANLKWIEEALEQVLYMPKTTVKTTVKRRIRPLHQLEDVMYEAMNHNGYRNSDLVYDLNIDMRTAQRYTRKLCQLRWLARNGWYLYYIPNPFLRCMLYPKKLEKIISKFVPLQVDLLKLFAYPLQLALKDEISSVEVIWSQVEPNWGKSYFPKNFSFRRPFYPYWNGIIQIKAEGKKQTYYSILPYNIHWNGRNCHICLPIPFSFYGVESAMYSKGKATIHFDNSVIVSIPLGSASYTTRGLLHKCGYHHWSDSLRRFMEKYWKSEYAECFDFDTHEQVLRDRLINKETSTNQITNKHLIIQQYLA